MLRKYGLPIGFIIGYLISGLILMTGPSNPQAIDVYQGKTTLEYKVIDGEIVDSCVVWKSK